MKSLAAAVREPSAELLAALVAGGLILGAVVVRAALAADVPAPQILCDEFIYGGIARSVEAGDGFTYRGVELDFSFVYPLLLAPAWAAASMDTTFEAAKLVNVAVMTTAAVPAYLWARRVASPVWALVACGLVLLMPAFAFTPLLMTENAAFPTFLGAALAVAYALERPVLWAQALAVGALGVAVATRYQSAILVLTFAAAAGLKLLFDRQAGIPRAEVRARALLHLRPLGVIAAAGAAYLLYKRIETGRFAAALGPYEELRSGSYPLDDVARWSVLHLAELALATGLVPAAALTVLVVLALRGDTRSESERAFVAVAAPTVLLVAVQVGAFATRVANWVVERYTFYAVPLLLLALVVWLARGLPRPRWVALAAAAVPVGAIVFLVIDFRERLFVPSLPVNTLSLYAVQRLPQRLEGNEDRAVQLVVLAAIAAAVAFVLLPRSAGRVLLPLGVAAALLAFSRPVVGATRGLAETSRSLAGQEAMWIDRELGEGESAALVITPHPDVYTSSAALLQTEFWNRRVEDVGLLGGSEICPLPADVLTVDPATGQIARPTAAGPVPVDESHVVVQRGTAVFGELVAEGGTVLSIPLALYRVIPPLRLETATDGIHADGWMGSDASYTRYAVPDEGGSVDIGLSRAAWTGPDVPGRVRIRIGRLVPDADGVPRLVPRETVRWTIHSGDQRVFRLAAPSPPFRVEVHIEPTFSPSEFGQPDPRQLGAQVTFTYLPPP